MAIAAVFTRQPVAPGLTAGRGLKPRNGHPAGRTGHVAPGLTAGRGLKHPDDDPLGAGVQGCARSNRRARIETFPTRSTAFAAPCCARSNRRARIETYTVPSYSTPKLKLRPV